ncbi:hypothetical protein PybrP1_004914 [[Pythium] brassicae (nom. inval.)]|nr:hypothetical protein PybrP1_004914 [[Pythium] brassicae (nom. inval.)]
MCIAMYKPVCGSNHKTYSNACELSIAQCRSPNAKITMMSQGECARGTSAPVTSTPSVPEPKPTTAAPPIAVTPAPASSQPTGTPAPVVSTPSTAKCSDTCMSDFAPLCGSDGKTYSNACELAVAQCKNPQESIAKAADGECGSGASPATPSPAPQSPAPGLMTSVPTSTPSPTTSSTKCTLACSSNFRPVCGSDGKTYSNSCALSVARCKNPAAKIVKVSDGECGSGSSGASPVPSTPGVGVPGSIQPATKAPKLSESKCEMACTKMLAPVCGSNGMTYNNVCELQLTNCKSGSSAKVTIAMQGECGAATVRPASPGGFTTTSTTSTTSTAVTTSTSTSGGGKGGNLRGPNNSPYQGQ